VNKASQPNFPKFLSTPSAKLLPYLAFVFPLLFPFFLPFLPFVLAFLAFVLPLPFLFNKKTLQQLLL
jgi:hypothetical protein